MCLKVNIDCKRNVEQHFEFGLCQYVVQHNYTSVIMRSGLGIDLGCVPKSGSPNERIIRYCNIGKIPD